MARRYSSLLTVFLLLVGLLAAAKTASPDKALLENVPHIRQKPDFCGEACAAMWLKKLGHPGDQDWVYDQSGLDPCKDILHARGCYTRELSKALTAIGFKVGPVYHVVAVKNADRELEKLLLDMRNDLKKGIPSIVCMHYDEKPNTTEHFRLVLGYDNRTEKIIYHEPAEKKGAYRRMEREKFLALWPLKYRKETWTVIRLRLESKTLKPVKIAAGHTAADYTQHIMKLKPKVPKKGFTILVQPPFVVIGDEPPQRVAYRSKHTVKWATDHIKQSYFTKDPNKIIDIWLFKDKESYRKHTKSIFNDNPGTPYGYYSHEHDALIMNIATGGGTLVHEIVHPYMHANFPECPSWFDEGLASLYEQSGERNGKIVGLTNWRLAGLQKTIQAKKLPAFKTLCSTTRYQFYYMDSGNNYAQARYLCYYLQENGLLRKFYREFHKNHKTDPTGYGTLLKILDKTEAQMPAWQKDWEAWVLKLRFP